ncbi:MAG: exosortase C-terminal domain/associated protein EpsI [Acidobacteriota bacterium]
MITSQTTRACVLSGCLLVSAGYLAHATNYEQIPIRVPLADLPMQLAPWQGARAEDLDKDVLAVLGVDEYINRVYRAHAGTALGLYIGYYQSQREGESMHSPLNCLPGAGWLPMSSGRLTIPVQAAANSVGSSQPTQPSTIEVNRYVVQKGGETMLVLYWYQSHGRVVASEYWGKIYMVLDAIRTNRTDAALVRVIVPVADTGGASEQQAERVASDFVRTIFPLLGQHLPA